MMFKTGIRVRDIFFYLADPDRLDTNPTENRKQIL